MTSTKRSETADIAPQPRHCCWHTVIEHPFHLGKLGLAAAEHAPVLLVGHKDVHVVPGESDAARGEGRHSLDGAVGGCLVTQLCLQKTL